MTRLRIAVVAAVVLVLVGVPAAAYAYWTTAEAGLAPAVSVATLADPALAVEDADPEYPDTAGSVSVPVSLTNPGAAGDAPYDSVVVRADSPGSVGASLSYAAAIGSCPVSGTAPLTSTDPESQVVASGLIEPGETAEVCVTLSREGSGASYPVRLQLVPRIGAWESDPVSALVTLTASIASDDGLPIATCRPSQDPLYVDADDPTQSSGIDFRIAGFSGGAVDVRFDEPFTGPLAKDDAQYPLDGGWLALGRLDAFGSLSLDPGAHTLYLVQRDGDIDGIRSMTLLARIPVEIDGSTMTCESPVAPPEPAHCVAEGSDVRLFVPDVTGLGSAITTGGSSTLFFGQGQLDDGILVTPAKFAGFGRSAGPYTLAVVDDHTFTTRGSFPVTYTGSAVTCGW